MSPRIIHIGALCAALLASGAAFLYLHPFGSESVVYERIASIPAAPTLPPSPLMTYPDPDTYQQFVFAARAEAVVDITCEDAYATVLIYPRDVDYRKNPTGAKHNIAYLCEEKGDTALSIDLHGKPFTVGETYYIVRAHQGSGEWYNPY